MAMQKVFIQLVECVISSAVKAEKVLTVITPVYLLGFRCDLKS